MTAIDGDDSGAAVGYGISGDFLWWLFAVVVLWMLQLLRREAVAYGCRKCDGCELRSMR